MKYSIYNKKNIAVGVNIIYSMFRINFKSYLNISKCKKYQLYKNNLYFTSLLNILYLYIIYGII